MKYDPKKIEDGVYLDMPIEIYHANKTHFSASSIKEAFKSMAHFKAYLNKDDKRQSFFDFGNAFELSVVDNEEFEKSVAIFDESKRPEPTMNFGSTANKKWKADFYKSNTEKLIISENGSDSLDTLTILKDSLYSHPAALRLLKNCEYQTSVFWTDPKTGLKLKTRPDFWKPGTDKRSAIISDLKTDKDSESDKHLKSIFNLNYPIQACLQIKGLRHAKLIEDSERFFWIVCSKSEPFNTEVYEFDSSDIESFMDALDFKIEEIKRALDKGIFLSYEPERDLGIKPVYFPYYYKQKMGVAESLETFKN